MLPYLAPILREFIKLHCDIDFGPLRLLNSHLMLIGLGAFCTAFFTWKYLPGLSNRFLPRDRGRMHTPNAHASVGKPTGGGLFFVLISVPFFFLLTPLDWQFAGIFFCLLFSMLTGFFDDRAEKPWGELQKGLLDALTAFIASMYLCKMNSFTIWLPLMKETFDIPPLFFLPISTGLIWICINAVNCSDGVDGLAGTLTLLSIFYLGGFMYIVIGHINFSQYLLVPHDPDGARWAIMLFISAGALTGYLWHNAEPSKILMGDAGSRFLGMLLGVAVVATRNPFLIVVVAPVVLVNGGTGLVKLAVLRFFKLLGFDVRPPHQLSRFPEERETESKNQHPVVRILHKVRFPLHDHCRKNLGWSNAQVLMRFVLLQAFLIPALLGLLVKLR